MFLSKFLELGAAEKRQLLKLYTKRLQISTISSKIKAQKPI